ncbi:MAG: THUMP domain-containing protein [Candidatus Thorarchaeota archaeon]
MLKCEVGFLQEFNILVGCPREREQAAKSEVRYFIGDLIGDDELRVHSTSVIGLITCMTALNPFDVIKKLKEFADENPYQFRYAIKFTPLELCVKSNIESIVKATETLISKIEEDETFRVTVRRRHTNLENMEVVEAVAGVISRKVNLENPDKTVWVEIVGELTGISVLNPEVDILSIMTLRDDIY